MANLTLTFLYMEREHIGKDVSCVPWYLARALGTDIEIVSLTSATNRDFPAEDKGIKYRFLFRRGDRGNGWWKLGFFWWYLLWNGRKIDILMRFHYSPATVVEVVLYKILNPHGKAYIKCDTDHKLVDKFPHEGGGGAKLWLYRKAIRSLDVVSCETSEAYRAINSSKSPWLDFGDKLVFVPNGFDEQMLVDSGITVKPFIQKENVMITVGRLGTEQKNTEMLLEALAVTDMKDWTFYLVGPVDQTFQPIVDRFFEKHPEKRGSVVFTGPIYDKRELWEYYNRAKVFVLTSIWESYALVLNEAKRFGCYMVSTDVGAARDLIGDNEHGEYIEQNDAEGLKDALQKIICGQTNTDVYDGDISHSISWEHVLAPVVEKLKK